MKRFFRLCLLYLKTAFSCMGRALITLAAILAIAALLLWKVSDDTEGGISVARVGMVMMDESDEMKLLYDFIRQMPVMRGVVSIETCSKQEAMDGLKDGNYRMVIVVPKGFVYDADHMRDTALEIYAPRGDILANNRIYALLSSVQSLMLTTESAIIGMYDSMEIYSYNTTVGEMENSLTETYIKSFLNHDRHFNIEYLSIYGNYSPFMFYGILIILFTSGILGVFMLRGYSEGMNETEKILMTGPRDKIRMIAAKIICFSVPFVLLNLVLVAGFGMLCNYMGYDFCFSFSVFGVIVLVSVVLSEFIFIFASFCGRYEGREALYVLIILLMQIMPYVTLLPSTFCLYGLLGAVSDNVIFKPVVGLVVYLALFLLVSFSIKNHMPDFLSEKSLEKKSQQERKSKRPKNLYFKWFRIKLKQNLSSPVFLLEAVILVLLIVSVNILVSKNQDNNRVIYSSMDDTKKIIEELAESEYSGFDFEYADESRLKREILTGKAVAALESSPLGITIYAPAGSYSAILLRELIYPYILKKDSPDILSEYLKGLGLLEGDEEYLYALESNRRRLDELNLNIFKISETEINTEAYMDKKVNSILCYGMTLILLACIISTAYETKLHKGFLNSKCFFVRITLVIESGLIRALLLAAVCAVVFFII